MKYDVAIVGAGFTGSLLASVLARHGLGVALLDPATTPRFAIGESSTPLADLLLEQIGHRWDLPELLPLARYRHWKTTYPQLACGPKRGFSYFCHAPQQPFSDTPEHPHAMLVTASPNDELADTHWLRQDVDFWLLQRAIQRGAHHLPARVTNVTLAPQYASLELHSAGHQTATQTITAEFVVFATGANESLERLGIAEDRDQLLTRSYARFAHLTRLPSWDQWLADNHQPHGDYPFASDDAAQHHILPDGWLWMLRFDHGVTSVGRVISSPFDSLPHDAGLASAFQLDPYPTLKTLFATAELHAPASGPVTTARLQKFKRHVVGDRFALMPTAAATIDPLHSSGIAHGLSGVWRLAELLLDSPTEFPPRRAALNQYAAIVRDEALMIDRLVAGCYRALPAFRHFTAQAMFYFAAAIDSEEKLAHAGELPALWLAQDTAFQDTVDASLQRFPVAAVTTHPTPNTGQLTDHEQWVRDAIAPWNRAGLLDPEASHMYRYTAAPKG